MSILPAASTHHAIRSDATSSIGLPPGPTSASLLQTYRYTRNPLALLDECAARFGDIFTLRLVGSRPWVMLSSPALAKAMFTAPPDAMHAGEANFSVFGPVTGPASVLTMDETPHRQRRQLMLPQFHGDRMRVYFEQIRQTTSDAIDAWRPGAEFAMHRVTQAITLQVIIRAVFGIAPEERTAHDRELVEVLTDLANKVVGSSLLLAPPLQRDLGPWSPWGRAVRLIRRADEAILAAIRRRRAAADAAERHDILSLLLQSTAEDGSTLTDREVRDELVVMLMAGHETTATALAWAFERLLSLPDVEARLRTELEFVAGRKPIEADHLSRLEYLDAFLKESLRVRPIAPALGARVVTRPFEIGGYAIPAGSILANAVYLLHRRPDLYPEPTAFKPERFLGKRVIDPYAWAPFGGGIRRCLGMHFALFEMKTVITTVLWHARLRARTPNARPVPRGFFLIPERGLRVALDKRR
jgi:cytochrome P450 family 110